MAAAKAMGATGGRIVSYAHSGNLPIGDRERVVGYGAVGAAATFGAFAGAERITRLLGQTGINVLTRVMGLVLAAVGVEIMAAGLLTLFPGLGAAVG